MQSSTYETREHGSRKTEKRKRDTPECTILSAETALPFCFEHIAPIAVLACLATCKTLHQSRNARTVRSRVVQRVWASVEKILERNFIAIDMFRDKPSARNLLCAIMEYTVATLPYGQVQHMLGMRSEYPKPRNDDENQHQLDPPDTKFERLLFSAACDKTVDSSDLLTLRFPSFVCGSAVLQALFGEDWLPSDIDIFCCLPGHQFERLSTSLAYGSAFDHITRYREHYRKKSDVYVFPQMSDSELGTCEIKPHTGIVVIDPSSCMLSDNIRVRGLMSTYQVMRHQHQHKYNASCLSFYTTKPRDQSNADYAQEIKKLTLLDIVMTEYQYSDVFEQIKSKFDYTFCMVGARPGCLRIADLWNTAAKCGLYNHDGLHSDLTRQARYEERGFSVFDSDRDMEEAISNGHRAKRMRLSETPSAFGYFCGKQPSATTATTMSKPRRRTAFTKTRLVLPKRSKTSAATIRRRPKKPKTTR